MQHRTTVSKLQAALDWARRGFAVFPLQENDKVPLAGSNGHRDATTDPDTIRSMWRDAMTGGELAYNVGATPRDGEHLIVDLDVKNGRAGIADYLALGGQIDGLVVRTTSGGLHVYTMGADLRTGAGRLSPGIDTRGADGYVVAPGSTIDGKTYEIVNDGDILPTPQFVIDIIGTRAERDARLVTTHSVECDLPRNVERAIAIASKAEPAVSGCWHDFGYRLGCEMSRIGLSPEMAVLVLDEHWKPRGEGFKSQAQFERDVLGGYHDSVRDGDHGRHSVDAQLEAMSGLKIVSADHLYTPENAPAVSEEGTQIPDIMFSRTYAEGLALRDEPVPYLIKGLVGPGDIMAVLGGPGSGKSVVLPKLAFCVALGVPFLGFKVKRGRVLYFAAENGMGLERRLQVLGDEMGDPGEYLRVLPLAMDLSPEEPDVIRFRDTVLYHRPDLVIIDTLFASFPGVDITDRAVGIPYLVGAAKGLAAQPSRPVVCFGHHVPKEGEAAYGGQQLQALFDTTLFVKGELLGKRNLQIRKNRMGPDGQDFDFRIASALVSTDEEGDAVTAPVMQLVSASDGAVATVAEQDAWLAETTSGARLVMDVLRKLSDELVASGGGASIGEVVSGGPRARIGRDKLVEAIVAFGIIDEAESPNTRAKMTDAWLRELKRRGFVDYGTTDVWALPR